MKTVVCVTRREISIIRVINGKAQQLADEILSQGRTTNHLEMSFIGLML